MKVFVAGALALVSEAGHFRAINYGITQNVNSPGLTVSRAMGWRRQYAGYSGGCTQTHVTNKTPAYTGSENCSLLSGGSCGTVPGGYIVTDIEDKLAEANNFCYGYKNDQLSTPSGPYKITWSSCCWVQFTDDNGNYASGGSYGFIATVNDPSNNSPQVKLPPVWKIVAGCPAQTLDLSPVDLDGDKVKCRFADTNEALGAYHQNYNFGSITLDQETCILTYDGTKDKATGGVKPIALQVEDFDSNGNVISSMPVQFLATVWSPSNSNFANRNLLLNGPGNPYQYKPLFPTDDEDDEEEVFVVRGRRSSNLPSYCTSFPVLESPSPAAGTILSVPNSGIKIVLKASTSNGSITRFSFNSPIGMSCTNVDVNGEVTCDFVPSSSQMGQIHNFCFIADDSSGLQTERRCISLNAGAALVTTTAAPTSGALIDIFDMLKMLDGRGLNYENYGCAGRDNLDAEAKNVGRPIDAVDKALNDRKHCIKCVNGSYSKYKFDETNKSCQNSKSEIARSFCECDLAFVTTSLTLTYDSAAANYDAKKCTVPATASHNSACCAQKSGAFLRYNTDSQECCSDGDVAAIGNC